ncbi:right-handed parallel beta-helix repeat-containing protein [Dactylosporangium sp. NBC_01737]|uniref:right-handed parallel beta-helix repeat-containing protein n=1 Tax=Dactylosporangium sp. NBC_01737 TaxID=2975959 RepID=UPI002E1375D8|nr:right-handed parallel beta-helix repeat-containing protein [Dactylosporangium sp. NBC_01737]
MRTADPLVYDAHAHGLAGNGTTNDQPALAALVESLGAAYAADGRPRTIRCPAGTYSIQDEGVRWRNGVSLIGAGAAATCFTLSNPERPTAPTPLATFTTRDHGAGRDNHIADCTFAHFEIDGSGVTLPAYDVNAKGLFLQYVLRGRFHDLYIHDTGATGFGCDFLQDTVVDGVLAVHCGRLNNGEEMGGAGIGIGIGGWGDTERLTITGCSTVGNGTNGIFVELQKRRWTPPRGIRIIGCHAQGNRFGISDWGADGLIVSACTMTANHQAGYDVSALGTSSVAGRGGIVTGCVIDGNVWDGVAIGNTTGPYTVDGNRISRNGRYGYWQHSLGPSGLADRADALGVARLAGSAEHPAADIAVTGNDIWGNALDGVLIDSPVLDVCVAGNRVRSNGLQAAPGSDGGGATVSYTRLTMRDTAAKWLPDGHTGKMVAAGGQQAIVVANTATELILAPVRPGAATAWPEGTPPRETRYRLPDAPSVRAGITLAAAALAPTVRDNRAWDRGPHPTQTHGLRITGDGTCEAGRVHGNDLADNAVAPTAFDTAPVGGCWYHNLGIDPCPGGATGS